MYSHRTKYSIYSEEGHDHAMRGTGRKGSIVVSFSQPFSSCRILRESELNHVRLMSVVVDDDSDVGRSPARGKSHGSGLSPANWQDEGALMSSAFPLLDAAWERLPLKESTTDFLCT